MLWDFKAGTHIAKLEGTPNAAILDIAFSRRRLTWGDWHGNVHCADFAGRREFYQQTPSSASETASEATLTVEERRRLFPHSALLRLQHK
jgi:hypothetical protein